MFEWGRLRLFVNQLYGGRSLRYKVCLTPQATHLFLTAIMGRWEGHSYVFVVCLVSFLFKLKIADNIAHCTYCFDFLINVHS